MEIIRKTQELKELYRTGRISRREFLHKATLLGLSLAGASALAAQCAPTPTAPPATPPPTEAPKPTATPVPTATSKPTDTPVPAPTATLVPAAGPKRGGIMKHALHAPGNLDPAFESSIADDEIGRQWHDFLVYLDEDNKPDKERSLATGWESNADGTVWTFEVRKGVTFHNGKDCTAKEVVFTFDRLRNKDVGSAAVALYASIKEIKALDDYHIRFTLDKSNPDLPLDLGDYHALIMDSEAKDFKTDKNGTGPWMIESYLPEDRLVFKRNPNYWLTAEDGKPLPYMDGMEYIFMNEPSAQVEALRGGQVHWINYVDPQFVSPLQADPNVKVAMKTGNFHYVIHMRCDKAPTNDNRVRQALKLATDRSAMLQTVALGLGDSGRDTPIGPSYGDYYLDVPEPKRDVAKAKALLAEAGYPNGLEIELTCMNSLSAPAIATVWKEQLKEAGVTVNIKLIPIDVYYTDVWLQCDFGITDWGGRAYPQPYLQLAYISTATWNSSHFKDEELDKLAEAAGKEMDHATRVELYHKIQQIFMERGGIIVPFFQKSVLAYRINVKPSIVPAALAAAEDFRRVWLES
jgi:peptide/nickel transport system substrate-binding protein